MRNIKNCAKSGFTLGELLITIAIISVLIAVAVPVLNANLERAREAVDLAHLRQAKSAAAAYFITNPPKEEIVRKYYDVRSGAIVSWLDENAVNAIPRYGKGTSIAGMDSYTDNGLIYGSDIDVRNLLIMITCDQEGNLFCGWVNPQYAMRENPFQMLAVNNGKLQPVRANSTEYSGATEVKYRIMDEQVRTLANTGSSSEIYEIFKLLRLYYPEITQESGKTEYDLRLELFLSSIYSLTQKDSQVGYYYNKSSFQTQFCDAEAATLATQFWALIAEYNHFNVDTKDAITSATLRETYERLNPSS